MSNQSKSPFDQILYAVAKSPGVVIPALLEAGGVLGMVIGVLMVVTPNSDEAPPSGVSGLTVVAYSLVPYVAGRGLRLLAQIRDRLSERWDRVA